MKQENQIYYTTQYSWQMVICGLAYIAVNIAMYDIFNYGTVPGALITVVIQTGLVNGMLNYLFFGITRTKGLKWKIIMPLLLALADALLILAAGKYSLTAHIALGFMLAAAAGRTLRHANGDNLHIAGKADDIVDVAHVPGISGLSAYFPVDMGNKHKKLGVINSAGKAVYGKYAGKVVVFMEHKEEIYICPIWRIGIINATSEMLLDIYLCECGLLERGEL